ncbi:leader peptidase (prepilin peptidase)/N-methyltransferase [Streptomyces sp. 1114.5]|uniref:prepilin peptidase n=1 Tax=Streptomyces sp. 1114.5 TaxID=1938830 RepID=UPI000EB37840|nr:prepilin peptidase [Streptomyces sp. 1114.5]RKT16151.1 leader peptidase (prepilin peptidase)/N-methyltransferase [Streptomyces sp. 1114.5]
MPVVPVVAAAVLVGLLAAPPLRGLIAYFAVPEGEPWCGACPLCGRAVRLLPPSGRCPGCRGRLGAGAGTVEAVAAAVAAGVAYAADGPVAGALGWAGALGVALGFVDGRVRRLPHRLNLSLLAGVAALLAVAALAEGRPGVLLRCLLAALAIGAVLELAVWARALGPGDSPLGGALGGLLGWYGWSVVLGGLFAAVVLAGLWAVLRAAAALLRRRPVRGLDVPVGPFLLLGALTAVLAR